MTIKISIIIPIYNAQYYLERLINSLNSQTDKNFEAILVNDGSTDQTATMLDEYAKKYSFINVIHQENSGAPAARNHGLRVAKGEYVYFCDGDDELEPITIELFNNKINESHADLILGFYNIINLSRQCYKKITFTKENVINKKECMVLPPFPGNKVMKKSILLENNIEYKNVKIGQDVLFYQMILPVMKSVDYVAVPIYKYYINLGSISNSYDERILGIIETLNQMDEYYKEKGIYNTYRHELQYLRNDHILAQVFKIPFIRNKSLRKEAFDKLVVNFNFDSLELNYKYNWVTRNIYRLFPKMKFFFISGIFAPFDRWFLSKYYTLGYKKINNQQV